MIAASRPPTRADGWRRHAACAGMQLRTFFSANTGPARAVCIRCQVRPECLYDAQTHRAPNGIWGGLSVAERRALPSLPATRAAALTVLSDHLAAHDSADSADSTEQLVSARAPQDPLNETDPQGGPGAARDKPLHPADEGATMTTDPQPTPPRDPAGATFLADVQVDQLLTWGDHHTDPDVQDQAARARIALHGLHQRHAADLELTSLATEEERLEQRLAKVRARKEQLVPAAKPKRTRQKVDYPAAQVRAWARAQDIDCPATGRVPKKIVDAWRAQTGPSAGAPS